MPILGGVVFTQHASVHPAKYYAGILQTALNAGARVTGHCPATAIDRSGDGFIVSTPKGKIKAGKVVVATNGYSGSLMPYVKRRLIPIGSYIIATEPLEKSVMDRLFPKDRVVSDSFWWFIIIGHHLIAVVYYLAGVYRLMRPTRQLADQNYSRIYAVFSRANGVWHIAFLVWHSRLQL